MILSLGIGLATITVICLSLIAFAFWPQPTPTFPFPNGHAFALAICDDTDASTLENTQPVYDFLYEQGLISTKTVWVLPADKDEHGYSTGTSIADIPYKNFALNLQKQGFEVALHGARGASSERSLTVKALAHFETTFGHSPNININHSLNQDNLYWGPSKFNSPLIRGVYTLAMQNTPFSGHIESSPYFWGDIAANTIKYSRLFSFYSLNLAAIDNAVPFHDPSKPFVAKWFHTSDGHDVDAFNRLMRPENIDALERSGGYSIIYTHFGKGFVREGRLDETFQARIEDLTQRNVWLTTTSNLLNFLEEHAEEPSKLNQLRYQIRWVLEKIWHGRS